jgi:hypothetical protein
MSTVLGVMQIKSMHRGRRSFEIFCFKINKVRLKQIHKFVVLTIEFQTVIFLTTLLVVLVPFIKLFMKIESCSFSTYESVICALLCSYIYILGFTICWE